jgi:MFS family permease
MSTASTAAVFDQPADAAAPAAGPRFRLFVMMVLELFVWGAWLPLIFGYLPSLHFTPLQQSWTLNAFALASFVGMFFSNQFADRNFSAERFLAVSHLIGGVSILGLFWVHGFWPFFVLMLIHCLFYVPTLSITNSIAFAHLKDPKRDYGLIRLGGTIGWIAASWPFIFILVDWAHVPAFGSVSFTEWLGTALRSSKSGIAAQEATRYTFMAAGLASFVLAAFSLALPHTPPKPAVAGREQFAWLEAMRLLKVPFILVLFVVTFFDAAVHQCFFIWTNDFLQNVGIPANWIMPAMTVGQFAEIATMAVLGLVLKRLGWRTTMIVGILGHAVRFAIFALAPNPVLAVAVNVLHGICYAFFFATVYIFVDEFFPKDARTSAQGLFNFLILGFGPFVANFVWPAVGAMFTEPVPVDRASPAAVVVPAEDRNVTVNGTAGPEAKVVVTFDDGRQTPVPSDVTADKDGKWSLKTQFIAKAPAARYTVEVAPKEGAGAAGTSEKPVSPKAQSTAAGGSAVPPPATLPTTAPAAATAVAGTPPAVTDVTHVNFRKLFLVPSGTALFAMLLLLLFFHPPETAKREGEGLAVTPH